MKRKRDQLDEAIVSLERVLSDGLLENDLDFPLNEAANNEIGRPLQRTFSQSRRAGQFDGLSILSAARIALERAGEPLTCHELAQILIDGGYPARSKDFPNTIAAVLNRCDKTGGDITRVGKNLFSKIDRQQALTITEGS
jgi:hypothetical protein